MIVNDKSNANYAVENENICSTEVLKSNHCDYNDAYILVRADIVTMGHNYASQAALKNFAPFINFIGKIDGTVIDDVEDLHLIISMYSII